MKLIKIASAFAIGLLMVNCTDLEESLTNEAPLPESAISATETFLSTSFAHMHHRQFLSREMAQALMFRSDMMAIGRTGVQERIDHDDFTVEASNGLIDTYWPRVYQIIGSANQALVNISGLNAAEDDAEINEIIGRARFARAFAYFHLVRQFGAVPYLDENSQVIDLPNTTRLPAEEVYANIIADLEFAKQWLPDTQATRAIPAKSAASGYLALVYFS